ncbi:hypothetical protein [Labilithrix luteola]|nr:hypothetical protein [Labilithrix luteola]
MRSGGRRAWAFGRSTTLGGFDYRRWLRPLSVVSFGCLLVVGCEESTETTQPSFTQNDAGTFTPDAGANAPKTDAAVDAGNDSTTPPPASTGGCRVTGESFRETSTRSYNFTVGITYDPTGVISKWVRYDSMGFENYVVEVTSPDTLQGSSTYGTTRTKFGVPLFAKTAAFPSGSTGDSEPGKATEKIDYWVRKYEYDSKNRVVKWTEATPSIPTASTRAYELTYDDNDNVRTVHPYLIQGGNPQPSPVYTVTGYDDKHAPRSATPYFVHLDPSWGDMIETIVSLSRNNPLGYQSDAFVPETLTLTYQYNAEGYPTERSGTLTGPPNGSTIRTHVRTFTYECN